MTTAIWKWQIPVEDGFCLQMPKIVGMLDVQVQHGVPCLWCMVEPGTPEKPIKFRVVGTGHELDEPSDEWLYLGTFQLYGGGFVGHLFVAMDDVNVEHYAHRG